MPDDRIGIDFHLLRLIVVEPSAKAKSSTFAK
ncbi:Uncharacterised protein [Burkholderia cepacia]|nr:hypothetical protein DM41_7653 [Burkholderia cepacia ATCC 25416]SPU84205.1 Uncharacterised protein [Burkholderia cepacia]